MKNLKYTREDDWHHPLYEDVETGTLYVEVDGVMHFRTIDYGEPICAVDFEYTLVSTPEPNPQKHIYMMLDMMRSRVDYFLGWGKGHLKHLNGESIDQHINEMKDHWNSLKIKPEGLTMKQINDYHERMKGY
jgi:hypothetical protein